MSKLDDALEKLAQTKGDNNEHLKPLHDLVVGAKAQQVVELGVGYGRFTTAILAALEKTGGKLASCDNLEYAGTRSKLSCANWTYTTANDLEWGKGWTEPLDVLVIDSSHERAHTESELRLFGRHVRAGGAIVMHDTVSFPAVMEAIEAWRDERDWDLEHFENNNGLAVLTKIRRRVCRFPFAPERDFDSTSGPTVLEAALTEAFSSDERFGDFNAGPAPDDMLWFPTFKKMGSILEAIHAKRPVAIGPNVLFALSRVPGSGKHEAELCGYTGYSAIFTLSRWYAELLRKNMVQQTNHHLVDYPLPSAWRAVDWFYKIERDALIVVKGGKEEEAIAAKLVERFPSNLVLRYGAWTRKDLMAAAASSRACFYISREDQYPLAAVEIGLMGCPIISDERSCPVVAHRLTGIVCPVRERSHAEPFTWSADAADRMAAEFAGAVAMDRPEIRRATIERHGHAVVDRVAAILGV